MVTVNELNHGSHIRCYLIGQHQLPLSGDPNSIVILWPEAGLDPAGKNQGQRRRPPKRVKIALGKIWVPCKSSHGCVMRIRSDRACQR